MNSLGIGEGVDIQAIPSTIPDAPQFSYVGHGDGYVAMHWTAPSSNGSSDIITSYKLYKSVDIVEIVFHYWQHYLQQLLNMQIKN